MIIGAYGYWRVRRWRFWNFAIVGATHNNRLLPSEIGEDSKSKTYHSLILEKIPTPFQTSEDILGVFWSKSELFHSYVPYQIL